MSIATVRRVTYLPAANTLNDVVDYLNYTLAVKCPELKSAVAILTKQIDVTRKKTAVGFDFCAGFGTGCDVYGEQTRRDKPYMTQAVNAVKALESTCATKTSTSLIPDNYLGSITTKSNLPLYLGGIVIVGLIGYIVFKK